MNQNPEPVILKIGKYEFTPQSKQLSINLDVIKLTNKESRILEFLTAHLNQTSPRIDMITNVWGSYDYNKGRSMDVFISRLRKHLGQDKSIQIINVFGSGYSLTIKNNKPLNFCR